MKILVTGGAGFIGVNLIHYLIRETDHDVINLDKLTYAGNLSSLEGVLEHPRHTFVQVDLCDTAQLEKVFMQHKPTAVIHLAAESHVDRSIDGPSNFIATNIVGTFNLLQAAQQHWNNIGHIESNRFLHVSTDEVYGSLSLDSPAFNEKARYDPHSPYSASKAASDHLARAWQDTYRVPVIVTNCSNNYGPFQFPEKLIPVVILKASRREPIPVYGNGQNIRDWLYVEDHCRALIAALEQGEPGETYNVGGNNEMTNLDLVNLLCDILDQSWPSELNSKNQSYRDLITFVTDRPGHDFRYAIDASKIKRELHWSPSESAKTGFSKTVRWYLDNQEWWKTILDGSYQFQRQGRIRS